MSIQSFKMPTGIDGIPNLRPRKMDQSPSRLVLTYHNKIFLGSERDSNFGGRYYIISENEIHTELEKLLAGTN